MPINRVQNLENGHAAAITTVLVAGMLNQPLKGEDMSCGQIADVDIVAYAGTVGSRIVGSENIDMVPLSTAASTATLIRCIESPSSLSRSAERVRTRDIEIAQGPVIESVRSRAIRKHPFGHQL